MKNTLITISSIGLLAISCQNDSKAQISYTVDPIATVLITTAPPIQTEVRQHPSKKIKLALILDTSSSMDGLIEQAKSQLWNVVNKLADAKCDNLKPSIEIALYEYGNDRLNAREGYIRLVTGLTSDLDQLSEDLFSLKTGGGSEHCGQVISTSLNQLDWSESSEDLQVIFIAGNEPFTQGPINYRTACKQAKENNVTVNTIFCGDFNDGINDSWKSGAMLTSGEYMSINQNSKTVYTVTPYDEKISKLNDRLNDTYIYYGRNGNSMKEKQMKQDLNAESYSLQNKVKRTISKSKHIYKNSSWDLVDASNDKDFELSEIESTELNDDMKEMNITEQKKFIQQKANERGNIKSEIAKLGKQRDDFILNKEKETVESINLDDALISAITKQATEKKFEF